MSEFDLVMKARIPAEYCTPHGDKIWRDLLSRHAMSVIDGRTTRVDVRIASYSVGELDACIGDLDGLIRSSVPPPGTKANPALTSARRRESFRCGLSSWTLWS